MHRQSGVTYLLLLFVIAIMGAGLAATGVIWHQLAQRDREKELLVVGDQFRQAIALTTCALPAQSSVTPNEWKTCFWINATRQFNATCVESTSTR